jgi:hypothetical protein
LNPVWIEAAAIHIAGPRFWFALFLPAAIAILIHFNDWYTVRREAQRKSTVEALEALFALRDLRGSRTR